MCQNESMYVQETYLRRHLCGQQMKLSNSVEGNINHRL
jgi:hypothetical protein